MYATLSKKELSYNKVFYAFIVGEHMRNHLAINGGTPVISRNFPRYNSIGEEEKKAANRSKRGL